MKQSFSKYSEAMEYIKENFHKEEEQVDKVWELLTNRDETNELFLYAEDKEPTTKTFVFLDLEHAIRWTEQRYSGINDIESVISAILGEYRDSGEFKIDVIG